MDKVWIVVVSLLISAGAAGAAPRSLAAGQFGNLFTEKQPLQVTVGSGDAAVLMLEDSSDAVIQQRKLPAASTPSTVDFGTQAPGYYELVSGESRLPLVVVVDPARRLRGESRLATDNAMSWLVKPDQYEGMADALRLAGFGWVRERLAWGEVEPTRGQFDWGRYDRSATVLANHGIHVYQIFHASPGWSRADHDSKAPPDDLRDIYEFARELGRHFAGRVQAWEVWNEPDGGFSDQPASELAAFQKAAFLGFRSADPRQKVLGPSMAGGPGPFPEDLLANDAGHYMDIWNYHVYADPSVYAGRYRGFRSLLARHGVDLPSWVTEAGDAVQGPDGVLTRQSQFHQAAFISRAYAQALAAGEDRHFWFVFPFYKEGETGWGVFAPGNNDPYPGLAALATATYALGRGDYLGQVALPGEARALAFSRDGKTAALVVWREADAPVSVDLPLSWKVVREACTYLGTPLPTGAGPVSLQVGRAADYPILPRSALSGRLIPPPTAPSVPRAPAPKVMDVVVRLLPGAARVSKDADGWLTSAGAALPVSVQVYNFGSHLFRGEIRFSAPPGWKLDRDRLPVVAQPGGRLTLSLQVTAPNAFSQADLRAVAASGAGESSAAVARLLVDPATVSAKGAAALQFLSNPESWRSNIAGHGTMKITAVDGGVRFSFTFHGPGDNWAYPEALCAPVLDLSGYTGLRFHYRTSVADSGPVRLMLVQPNGTAYYTSDGLPGSTEWRSATVLFSDLSYLPSSTPDPDGHLNLGRISTLRIGANCRPQSLDLEVRDVEAVKL